MILIVIGKFMSKKTLYSGVTCIQYTTTYIHMRNKNADVFVVFCFFCSKFLVNLFRVLYSRIFTSVCWSDVQLLYMIKCVLCRKLNGCVFSQSQWFDEKKMFEGETYIISKLVQHESSSTRVTADGPENL